jgi:thiol-disulfide isomerase/thioredoxin
MPINFWPICSALSNHEATNTMNQPRSATLTLIAVILSTSSLLAGVAAYRWHQSSSVQNPNVASTVGTPATALVKASEHGSPRPDFTLNDMEGKPRHISEWDGKVLAVNFWATWCPPCKREIPTFIKLQRELGAQGLQFIGIAVDDLPEVVAYATEMGINYPILVGQSDAAQVSREFGNRIGALPFTAIVDRQGNIVYTEAGEMSYQEMRDLVHPLLAISTQSAALQH